jgi:hypothetical protein
MRRERALKVVLVVVGLLFCAGVYPLIGSLLHPASPSSRAICQFVTPNIVFVISVAAHPLPFNVMQLRKAVNFLPELPILYRLFPLALDFVDPAVSFPRGNPTRHPLLDVLRVSPNGDVAMLLQGPQTFDHGAELHPVVGGVRLAPN